MMYDAAFADLEAMSGNPAGQIKRNANHNGRHTMTYIDGLVLAVPTANKETYRELSEKMAAIFRKHGATGVVECWGDEVPDGEVTSFPMAVKCKPDETVVFSWVAWPDKATRDAGKKKVFEEMEASGIMHGDNPFDGKRMIFGGFQALVEA